MAPAWSLRLPRHIFPFRLCQGSSASICRSRGLAHRASSSRTARLQPSFKFMALSAGADGDWRCTITVLTPDAGCHLAHRVLIDLNKPWLSASGFFTRMHEGFVDFNGGDQGFRAAARGSRSSYQRSERCAATAVNLTAGTKPFALWRARVGASATVPQE